MGQHPRPWAVMGALALALGALAILAAAEDGTPAPVAGARPVDELCAVLQQALARRGELPPAHHARAGQLLPSFLAALDRLGRLPAPAAGGGPELAPALQRCAVAYHRDPGRWDQLLRTYGRPAPGSEAMIVVRPQALEDAHLGPEFQAFWRLALVAPRNEALELMKRRVYEALAVSAEADAVPVIAWRLEHGGDDADVLIDCLGRLDHDASVAAVVAGLHAHAAQPPVLAAGRRAFALLLAGAAGPRRRAMLAELAAREAEGPVRALLQEQLASPAP